MIKEIDARGLACPAPVLNTKKEIDLNNPSVLKIIVDNEAARQNVTRFLQSQQFIVTVDTKNNEFCLTGTRDQDADVAMKSNLQQSLDPNQKILIMVTDTHIGHGDDNLGAKLMISFLKTIKELGQDLWRLVFVNNGVKLTIAESEVLPILKELEDDGIHILVCGTCLDHFNILEQKEIGETTNMLDIVTAMQLADKVITI